MGRRKKPREEVLIWHQYYEDLGKTLNETAAKFSLKSGTTVLHHFQNHGLATRPRGGAIKESQAGDQNGNWKGGRSVGRYVRIWKPNHPRSSGGYVYEHDLIAEAALGRHLRPGEIVHHANKNGQQNHKGNLVICAQDFHAWLHKEGRVLR